MPPWAKQAAIMAAMAIAGGGGVTLWPTLSAMFKPSETNETAPVVTDGRNVYELRLIPNGE